MKGNLPQGQTLIHREATCPTACTNDFTADLHVFGHLLHMHHYGRKIYTGTVAALLAYLLACFVLTYLLTYLSIRALLDGW